MTDTLTRAELVKRLRSDAKYFAPLYSTEHVAAIRAAADMLEADEVALMPFAAIADLLPDNTPDETSAGFWSLKVGDFRRARKAAARAKGETS